MHPFGCKVIPERNEVASVFAYPLANVSYNAMIKEKAEFTQIGGF